MDCQLHFQLDLSQNYKHRDKSRTCSHLRRARPFVFGRRKLLRRPTVQHCARTVRTCPPVALITPTSFTSSMHAGSPTQLTSITQLLISARPFASKRRWTRIQLHLHCCKANNAAAAAAAASEPRQEGQQHVKRPDEHIKKIKEFGCAAGFCVLQYFVASQQSQFDGLDLVS